VLHPAFLFCARSPHCIIGKVSRSQRWGLGSHHWTGKGTASACSPVVGPTTRLQAVACVLVSVCRTSSLPTPLYAAHNPAPGCLPSLTIFIMDDAWCPQHRHCMRRCGRRYEGGIHAAPLACPANQLSPALATCSGDWSAEFRQNDHSLAQPSNCFH
jgi:hypothetical protein